MNVNITEVSYCDADTGETLRQTYRLEATYAVKLALAATCLYAAARLVFAIVGYVEWDRNMFVRVKHDRP